MENKPRLLRITTVPISLKILLQGQLSFFQRQGFEVLAVSADGPEVVALQAEGIPHQVVKMTRQITPFHDLITLFNLIRVIRKFKPDIVHTHTPKAGLLGMLAAWICGIPVRMHTVAGLPLMERRGIIKKVLVMAERLTYACATRVYPNSNGLKQYIQTFAPNASLKVLGRGSSNGINTQFFSPTSELQQQAQDIRASYGISPRDIVFSFAGRIVRDKGMSELVSAFRKLLSEAHAESRYYLLLLGTFERDLDPLSKEDDEFLHAHAQVILPGFKQDVRPWLMASDVFVFPSYREGFPNVVMQAGCLKKPCIVSDINGCNEIVQHDATGLIIRPKNADDLFQAMNYLAGHEDKRRLFGNQAREFIVDNFDQQYSWKCLLEEYRQLLNHPQSRV